MTDKPDLELILRAFAVFDGFEIDCDYLWWRVDGEYAPFTLLINCNDLFVWGCSDCERLTLENIGKLEATKIEVKALKSDDTINCMSYIPHLWIARERKTRPQFAYYERFPKVMHALFTAVSDKPGYGWPEPE